MSSISSLPSSLLDTDEDSIHTRSTQSINRKKRTSNVAVQRSNKSHTSFFFRIDENNSELAYCKICELLLSGTQTKPYAYTRKGGNTSSMIANLRCHTHMTQWFEFFLILHVSATCTQDTFPLILYY